MGFSDRFREARASREAQSINRDVVSASARALAETLRDERETLEERAQRLAKRATVALEMVRTLREARASQGSVVETRATDGESTPRGVTKPGSLLPGESTPRGVGSNRASVRQAGSPLPGESTPAPRGVASTFGKLPGESIYQAIERSLGESSRLASERDAGFAARAMARALPLRDRDEERLAREDESVPHYLRPRARKKVRRLPPA